MAIAGLISATHANWSYGLNITTAGVRGSWDMASQRTSAGARFDFTRTTRLTPEPSPWSTSPGRFCYRTSARSS